MGQDRNEYLNANATASQEAKAPDGFVAGQAPFTPNVDTQQTWAQSASGATYGYAQQARESSEPKPKTKKQLIALTCALSLVCGMLGGVAGSALSNSAGSSQAGGMQQSSMQQPGGAQGQMPSTNSDSNAPGSSANGGSSNSNDSSQTPNTPNESANSSSSGSASNASQSI